MDVSFTNVLEGARQYFQGLPSASAAAGPYFQHQNNAPQQQQNLQQTNQQQHQIHQQAGQQQHQIHQQAGQQQHQIHQQTGQQQQQIHQQAGQQQQQIHQQTGQQQHQIHQQSGQQQHQIQPQQQVQQQQHQIYQQGNDQQYPSSRSTPGSAGTNQNQWQQPSPSEPSRPPTRECTPVQRPSSHSSAGSRPPSHPALYQDVPRQYHSPYQQQLPEQLPTSQAQQTSFQFSRPQSREAPSNHQFQPHIVTSSPYQQPSSPQIPRAPSREQLASTAQTYQHPQSPGYPPSSSQSQYGYQSRSYYPQPVHSQTQTKTTSSYLPAQPYQQNMYYKQQGVYTSQASGIQAQQSSYRLDNQNTENNMRQNDTHYQTSTSNEQQYRTTHNLPPIAALSSYHSSRTTKEPAKTTIPRNRIPSTMSQTVNNSSIAQQNQIRPEAYSNNSDYTKYQNALIQSHQRIISQATTALTQSYSNVIMTSTNTPHYNTPSNQSQASPRSLYQRSKTESHNLNRTQINQNMSYQQSSIVTNKTNSTESATSSVIKVKRESPLDLSVKTVRTSADSTDEGESTSSKYGQNNPPANSVSSHNYPTLDVNSIQRNLTHRSQLPTATAPKVEFHPNFNLPSGHSTWISSKSNTDPVRKSIFQENTNHARSEHNRQLAYQTETIKNKYPTGNIPSISQHLQAPIKSIPTRNEYNPNTQKPVYSYDNRDIPVKRPGEITAPVVPNKIPKVESWRHSIDLQIEQKLSHYKQQQQLQVQHQQQQQRQPQPLQQNKMSDLPPKSLVNGNYSSLNNYPKQHYEPVIQQHHQAYSKPNSFYPQNNHPQTYVPSPVNHQYPGYYNAPSKQSQNLYLNPAARSNSNPSLTTLNKQNIVGGVDKRVLDLLRTSIEHKEQKKLEQQKSSDMVVSQRSDVQHPSTDVTAPLQPKPGIDRNNISPFTPISVPDPNICKMPPKSLELMRHPEIEQIAEAPNKRANDEANTVIINSSNSNSDYDGLAAFLAARIRTKGELKQVAHTQASNNNTARDVRIQSFIEEQTRSPQKQNTQQISSSSSTTSGSTSPPKLLKERQTGLAAGFAPRKRLFSRNEEEMAKNGVPVRDKSGLRSSSETSVFDFPDTDDENEMPVLERQSLEAMRRDRRNSLKQATTPVHNMELEPSKVPSRPSSPGDDIFASICDKFVEQLKTKNTKRVKRLVELEPEVKVETASTDDSFKTEVKIKIEVMDDFPPIKTEKDEENIPLFETIHNSPVVPDKVDFIMETCKTPIVKNVIKSDSDMSDSEIKKDERMEIRNKHRVRRKIISSSDSSDENESENDNESTPIKKEKEEVETTESNCNKSVEPETEVSKIEIKQEPADKEKNDKEQIDSTNSEVESPQKTSDLLSVIRPAKKPSFGDGSDFYPGWEEGVYKYKKSLRMPPRLIQLTRPPAAMRLSTSLPDLDPCPQSPTASITTDTENKESNKKILKKFKSEPVDSDSESTSSFNVFSKRTNYDSEGSSSIKSLPNTKKENMSILDRLLEKCGGKKKRKHKRKDDHSPKVVPKAENQVELLATPTPGLAVAEKSPEKSKGLNSPVISAKSAVLPFRKDTVKNFKDAFIHSGNNILGVHDKFTTIVLSSRTRKETRAMKQRATIKEVFGEDRPASAPPVPCINDIQGKAEEIVEPFSKNLEDILIKKEKGTDIEQSKVENDEASRTTNNLNTSKDSDSANTLDTTKIKEEILDDDEDEDKKLIDLVIKKDPDARSETTSLDGDDGSITGKRRNRFGKIRRKFSSGFDYIRKKKKAKKEEGDNGSTERKKRPPGKAPESIDDIQKEVKSWVLNKGIGESHLHRAARLGYVDITAYCLEKMDCPPSPKDNAGYTPLHEACSRGHLEIAKLLLRYGANVQESAQGGIRPLHEAVENGFIEIVRLLLSYGADPSLATYSGVTPLSLASDEKTRKLLTDHVNDRSRELSSPWPFFGPASCFDPEECGYNVLDETPKTDSDPEPEDIEVDISEALLPNLYTLRGEPNAERWVLLQDLSNMLKIKSRDALLRQISPPSTSSAQVNYKSVLRELKMTDFLEQAHCCQFLNMGEKINTRASKIALVKYTDKVKELLGIETAVIAAR